MSALLSTKVKVNSQNSYGNMSKCLDLDSVCAMMTQLCTKGVKVNQNASVNILHTSMHLL